MFAEGIDGVHQALFGQGREHFVADMRNVVIRPASIFWRQGVGGKAGAAHGQWQLLTQTPSDPEHLALVGQVQAVAGFYLQGGHAIAHQRLDPLTSTGQQLVFAGRAGRPYGAGDTAAVGRDLGIADALQALLELTAAIAAEHRMGMAIDQARVTQAPPKSTVRSASTTGTSPRGPIHSINPALVAIAASSMIE